MLSYPLVYLPPVRVLYLERNTGVHEARGRD